MSAARVRRWTMAGLALVALAIGHRLLLGESYFLRDFWITYAPIRALVRDMLAAGTWPRWNHWVGGGLPLLAEPTATFFYPPSWPSLVFADQAWALSVLALAHNAFAAGGAYVLARRGASPPAAFIGGLAFGFGGLMISNLSSLHWHYAYAWSPWWFVAWLRLLEAPPARGARAGRAAALGAVWAMQLCAGEPQIVMLEGGVVLATLATRTRRREYDTQSLATWIGLAVALAVCASAGQLWSMAEALPYTTRAAMSDSAAGFWRAHPLRAWELVLATPWGHVAPERTFFALIGNGPWGPSFYFSSLYLGVLAAPGLLLGARRLERAHAGWVLGVALLLLASLGELTPLHGALRAVVPLWQVFRYPERLLVLPTLAAAWVVARGMDALLAEPRRRGWVFVVPLALSGLAVLWPDAVGVAAELPGAAEEVERAAWHAAVLSAVGLGVVWLRPALRAPLLAGLAAVDLVAVAPLVQATWTPPEVEAPALVGMVLHDTQAVQAAMRALPADASARRAFEAALARPNASIAHRIRHADARSSLELWRLAALRDAVGREDAELARGTVHIITRGDAPLQRFALAEALPLGLARFTARDARPEVDCVGGWQGASSAEEASAAVRRGATVAEGEACAPPSAPGPQPDTACDYTRDDDGTLHVRLAPHDGPVLVRVRQNHFPGWVAVTDAGESLAPCPVDVASAGARVPPGVRALTLRYEPAWWGPTLALSAAAWLALVAGLGWRARLRRRAAA